MAAARSSLEAVPTNGSEREVAEGDGWRNCDSSVRGGGRPQRKVDPVQSKRCSRRICNPAALASTFAAQRECNPTSDLVA